MLELIKVAFAILGDPPFGCGPTTIDCKPTGVCVPTEPPDPCGPDEVGCVPEPCDPDIDP